MVDTAQSLPMTQDHKLPIGSVIAETFQIYGKSPVVFVALGIASQLPSVLYLLTEAAPAGRFSAVAISVMIFNFLILFLLQTAMTYMAVRLADDQAAPIGDALRLGVRRYLPMLGTTILVLLAVYGGMILLIVPGLIFAIMFAVAVPVCAVEGLGPVESMKRSAALTKHTRWRILGIYVIFFVPLIAITMVISFALIRNGNPLAGQWLNLAIQIIWVPVATIFSAAIYIALRRIKENVGVARVFD